jgi:hypothetical protein
MAQNFKNMEKQVAIQIFEGKKVRAVWNAEEEKWYFSVIDVISVFTNSDRARKYWADLKSKLKKEGSQLSDFIGQLKMKSSFVDNFNPPKTPFFRYCVGASGWSWLVIL